VSIVGRETELQALRDFVASTVTSQAFVLKGGPGVGKTTLWEAGREAALAEGMGVLTARPASAETHLSFAALGDLLRGVRPEVMAGLPRPQRRVLEVALLRVEPGEEPVDSRALAIGVLGVLGELAIEKPLLVAIDDVHWLDRSSANALAFAARRLQGTAVRLLLATRPGTPSVVLRALASVGLQTLTVLPLGLGSVRKVLSDRLGLVLPREMLRRILELTMGNPLFVLEVGRTLLEQGLPATGRDLPVPDTVEELLGTRVSRLPRPTRRLLLAIALGGDLDWSQLSALADPGEVEGALDAGDLVIEGDRVRASHPLLAAAAKTHSRPDERRQLHRELADVVLEGEMRARHLALAVRRPDEELAGIVAAAAAGAAARGAALDAVELGEQALRLTPSESSERSERVLKLAEYLERVGERQRVSDLLTPELPMLTDGARVRAWLRLSEGGAIGSYYDKGPIFEAALADCGADAALAAEVLARKALSCAAEGVERIREAEGWALTALHDSPGITPEVERLALRALGWSRCLRGHSIDDLCERFRIASTATSGVIDSPEPLSGLRLVWRGEIESAREILGRFLAVADERGEGVGYAWLRLNMCELELRVGAWDAASRLLDEWAESGDENLLITPTYQRCRALVAVGRGDAREAQRWATPALADAEARGYRWQVLESSRALGTAALLAHEPGRALDRLLAVWQHVEHEGVEEPGVFPVAPDLVEALVELGELGEAQTVSDRLAELSELHAHPWGAASTRRCRALIRANSHKDAARGAEELALAATEFEGLGLRFDRARALLAVGRAHRRMKKWGAAREALQTAVTAFEELGSPGWADEATSELARVGARRPSRSGELTPTEQRVAELAIGGRSNKEIARALYVTVSTVEAHLSQVYAKLGVRSRTQLAGRLPSRSASLHPNPGEPRDP
jgi:DNA-binding CsgD family transcriptional regulator